MNTAKNSSQAGMVIAITSISNAVAAAKRVHAWVWVVSLPVKYFTNLSTIFSDFGPAVYACIIEVGST